MREIKTKVIWAILVISEDKEVVVIEPLVVKTKDRFGNVSTLKVEGHYTTPVTFLEYATELADTATKVLSKWTK